MIRKQADWMRRVKVGTVLTNGKMYRVVRKVSFYKNGDLSCVYLSIKRCSWTKRCYTVYNYHDLTHMGYAPVGATLRLDKPIDAEIVRNIRCEPTQATLDCCDVHDLP